MLGSIVIRTNGGIMGKRILLIQGHPDTTQRHFCHALEDAYANGATAAGCEIQRINVGALDFPLLHSQHEWENGALPSNLAPAQAAIKWAEHMVLFFPLWLGDMPALLKGFLEQVARPGFAFSGEGKNPLANKGLTGRSGRVVVTMGMPALVYRWYFRAHSIKSLERNILGFVGIAPVDETLIGMAGNMDSTTAGKWLSRLEKLGSRGA
jgi:putative NADPH-quinone reductase